MIVMICCSSTAKFAALNQINFTLSILSFKYSNNGIVLTIKLKHSYAKFLTPER